MPHVYTIDKARSIAERPGSDLSVVFPFLRHKFLPHDLSFRPTSKEDQHYNVKRGDSVTRNK